MYKLVYWLFQKRMIWKVNPNHVQLIHWAEAFICYCKSCHVSVPALMRQWWDCSKKSPTRWSKRWPSWSLVKTQQRQKVRPQTHPERFHAGSGSWCTASEDLSSPASVIHLRINSLDCFLEEDDDEVKLGTSCKNGGCTKVSETFANLMGLLRSLL